MRLLLTPILAAAAVSARVIKDSLPDVPAGWTWVRRAGLDEAISLRLAMRQQFADELEQKVLEVSTPGHPNYGKHLTRDEVRAYTAPSAEAHAGVMAWLKEAGITPTVDNDWVSFTTTVGAASQLLDTTFAWYQYEALAGTPAGAPKLRTLEYSVPDELAAHVDMVQPTTRFGQMAMQRSTIFKMVRVNETEEEEVSVNVNEAADTSAAACGSGLVTPTCLKTLYGINYTATASGNSVAFCSYLNEYARYKDLQSFESQYVAAAKGQNFSVQTISGGLNDQNSAEDSGEANLDVQYVLGISHPIPITEYSTGGLGPLVPTQDQPSPPGSNEPYVDFLTYILAQNDSQLPQTISTSYGEEEQSVPADYALKVCNLFMQLGARGVSVLFSSGDSGPGNNCVRNTDNATFFGPTFPAGCPYVTSVGATTNSNPESAVSFSSGGFSTLHVRPSWQAAAVDPYLAKLGSTYAPFFNSSGRGIPDVAAQGASFAVVDKGQLSSLSGTSASCPTFAGVVALLNAARKSQGAAPLGFLNPWLYNNSAALTDITIGSGIGCQSQTAAFGRSGARWNATAGWDPVTGLGTPNFAKLLTAAAPGVANK